MPLYILAYTCILNVFLCLVVVSSVSLDYASTPTSYKVSVLIWPHTRTPRRQHAYTSFWSQLRPGFYSKTSLKKPYPRQWKTNLQPPYILFFGKPVTKGWFYLQEKPYTHVSILFNTRIYFSILRIFHVFV